MRIFTPSILSLSEAIGFETGRFVSVPNSRGRLASISQMAPLSRRSFVGAPLCILLLSLTAISFLTACSDSKQAVVATTSAAAPSFSLPAGSDQAFRA